jgi:hypothetical protein
MVGEFRVGDVPANKEVNTKVHGKRKWRFLSSSFLRGSSRNSTGLPILPCLKEPNKIKNEVWFISFKKKCSIF